MSTADISGAIRELRDVQGRPGNWDYSRYMRGLYNGLELALATVEDRVPEYRDHPVQYLEELAPPDAMTDACEKQQG